MKEKIKVWIPAIVMGVLTVAFTIYYAVADNSLKTVYIQLALCLLVPVFFPVLGIITKKPFPVALNVLACYLVVVGIYFAKALNFYAFVDEYDKFLHTGFGLVGTAMIYTLLMRWGGDKLSPVGIIVIIFLGVLGVGALWEIFEYVCAKITFEDPQRVLGELDKIFAVGDPRVAWKQGLNPLADTIWDLIVTVIGSAVFIAFYIIDRVFVGGKICKKLFTVSESREVAPADGAVLPAEIVEEANVAADGGAEKDAQNTLE